jgi:hypothetical protein
VFDQAVAYERGHGVPRDFRKAGELYDRLCGGGSGDLGACTKSVEIAERLETMLDPQRASLMQRMCERGDKLGCINGLPGGKDEEVALRARGIDLDKLPEQCSAGDVSACRFLFVVSGLTSLVSSPKGVTPMMVDIARVSLHADADLAFDLTADACWAVVRGLCDPRDSGESRDWPACFAKIEADRKQYDLPAPGQEMDVSRACHAALVRACSAGSVPACEHFQGRRITSCVLCDAGDKRACGFSDIDYCRNPHPEATPPVSPACRDNPLAKGC